MEKVKKEVNTFFLIFRALLFPISLKHETFMILLLSSFRDYSESLNCTLTITFLLFNTDEFKVFLKSLPVREEKFKEMVEKQLQKVREESHVLFDFFFFCFQHICRNSYKHCTQLGKNHFRSTSRRSIHKNRN